jgi:myo-inositol-1(or 4)-monophosphatase
VAAEREGRPVVGVVIDPARREVWAAIDGCGAYRNGERCRVASGRSELRTALVATGFGYVPARRAWQAGILAQVLPAVRDVRRMGSAALDLCWLAGGRFDAYYEWGLNPWDLAAGELICAQAGAAVRILPGRTVVASVPELIDAMVDLLERAGILDPPDGPEPRQW